MNRENLTQKKVSHGKIKIPSVAANLINNIPCPQEIGDSNVKQIPPSYIEQPIFWGREREYI